MIDIELYSSYVRFFITLWLRAFLRRYFWVLAIWRKLEKSVWNELYNLRGFFFRNEISDADFDTVKAKDPELVSRHLLGNIMWYVESVYHTILHA